MFGMLTLLALSALAAEPAPPTPAEIEAESRRMSGEIAKAVQKNAWTRVERYYEEARVAGLKLGAADHLAAAEAAKTRGDLGAVYARLAAAVLLDPESTDAREQIAGLDRIYGRVKLTAVKGAKLEDYEHPFDPNQVKAVDYAIEQMKETGVFDGLLPPGPYSIDGDPFEVVAGRLTVLDVSPPPPPPKAR
ncbi:MAG: hypothetical protein R3F61_03020 [Myxococcota bacterium]